MSAISANGEALPPAHCRIGKIKLKRTSRYRSTAMFNFTTNKLRMALAAARELKGVRG